MRPMKRSEQIAVHVLGAIHPGAKVDHRSSQSNGEYDIDLTYADGRRAAVEVTSATIEESQRTLAHLGKIEKPLMAALCRNSWLVGLHPEARVKLVLAESDEYLSVIEADGIDAFYAGDDRGCLSVTRIIERLRIVEGRILDTRPPARIFVGGPSEGTGSMVRSEDLQRAVEGEAAETDNICKLAKSQCTERHLFVYVDQINERPWQAMHCRQMPEQPPYVSSEITHIWAAAEIDDGILVWAWERDTTWRDLGVIPRPPRLSRRW
jgi:hypothetical protein